jgi:phosphoribosylanthranilate isomerase
MIPRVKVCGNTRLEDALAAAELGADALGFIFWAPSPRAADPAEVARIVPRLPPFVVTVGVFVDESVEAMNRIADRCRLDRIQLHGQEPYETLTRLERPAYRARKPRSRAELEALLAEPDETLLLDTYDPALPGGTGRASDWDWAREAGQRKRVILAGGLNAGNIARAIAAARPSAVDVSSSLEARPGIKDPRKIEAFFRAFRAAAESMTSPAGPGVSPAPSPPSSEPHASAS